MADDIFKDYPAVQATYMKGDFNITCRGESELEVMQMLKKCINDLTSWVGATDTLNEKRPTLTAKNEVVGTCPDCGADVVFKSGVSKKNGKPYKGRFCTRCKYVEFLK